MEFSNPTIAPTLGEYLPIPFRYYFLGNATIAYTILLYLLIYIYIYIINKKGVKFLKKYI